jgi:DNA-binding MarR family transcriptional regulator
MIVMNSTPEDTEDGADASIDLGPLPGLIGYSLRRAQITVFQDFHQRFAAEDIRPAQYSVLQILKHNPGLRQTQVSFALGVKRTNFVPLFDTLEGRGLAERRKVPGDRRAFALFLTPAGTALLGRLDAAIALHEARFVARIGVEGKRELLSLLHRLADRAFDPP